ncbi:MAG: hypothetical protein M1832_004544 [Thelocarpon impressellum]|nr:MAG: hypothetical protein M1832_004544 [Thelocarpon impressellum]
MPLPGRTAPTSEASPTTPSTSTMRSPPPPPPTGIPQHKSLSRTSTGDTKPLRHPKQPAPDESEEEVTEYEGDYDTDIASGATHKDALKARVREGSPDGSTTIDDTPLASPSVAPPSLPPPVPSSTAPRGIPPPPRGQPPRTGRPSAEVPRAAPPPVPPPREQIAEDDGLEYDPFRYTGPSHGVPTSDHQLGPTVNAPPPDRYEEDNPYSGSSRQGRPSQPPRQGSSHRADDGSPSASSPRTLAPQPSVRAPPRQSLDMPKTPGLPRRSTDQARPSGEYGFIAADVDLGATSHWWTQPNMPPPVFQNRRDVLYEVEESSTSKRGGKTTISKDVYVLFQDYSQTVVTARFDSKDVAEVSLEQRHEAPPQRLRQDQLEDAHARFGQRISDGAVAKQNTSVGDGSPQALVMDLLQPLSDALMPVAGRAYGALVYANLANASVQQHDEIRAGDIMTLRNAKFQGHKGPMHQKYSAEVGKPDHVGVVVDWDGTKKKVRVWEQGRESRKVKMESFKVGDLRSGEVKIWRVMARSWVGWEGQN